MSNTTLGQFRDFLSGHADEETRRRIGAALRDEESDLRQFLDGVRISSELLLNRELDDLPELGANAGVVPVAPAYFWRAGQAIHADPFLFASMPSALLGEQESAGPGDGGPSPAQVWRFEPGAEDFTWHGGHLSDVAGRHAVIDVEEDASGILRVALGEFLRLGRGCSVRVSWQSASGEVRAKGGWPAGTSETDLTGPIELAGPPGSAPQVGDMLHVLYSWHPDGNAGWEISIVLGL